MAEQGAPSGINKQGHDETNKVVGEGPTNTSESPATSGGAAELTGMDRDPDARSDTDPGNDLGGPSMTTRVADPGQHPVEESSFAPGGDAVSQPGVKPEDAANISGSPEEKPSTFHGNQPQP